MKIILYLFLLIPSMAFSELQNHFTATYTVPVLEPDLIPYSTFQIEDYIVQKDHDTSQISYSLPLVLTGGEKLALHFKLIHESQGFRLFSGPLGTSKCSGPWDQMSCETRLDVKLNSEKIQDYIQNNVPIESQDKMLKVALDFSTEPIGFSRTYSLKDFN